MRLHSARSPGTSSPPVSIFSDEPAKSFPIVLARPPRCSGEKRFGHAIEGQAGSRPHKSMSLVGKVM